MRRAPCGGALIGLALAGAALPEGDRDEAAPPRDRPICRGRATATSPSSEELDAARRAGTLAAYDLFLARHGDHPLAAIARRERARIARATRP